MRDNVSLGFLRALTVLSVQWGQLFLVFCQIEFLCMDVATCDQVHGVVTNKIIYWPL